MKTHVLKKLLFPQLIKLFSAIYEIRISFLCSKNPPLAPILKQMNPDQTLSSYLLKSQFKTTTAFRDVQISQISRTNLKILGSRKVKRSKFHTEDSQILSATAQNFVAPLICSLLAPPVPGTFKVFSVLQVSSPIPCTSLLSQAN